jgi:hypothetical protein
MEWCSSVDDKATFQTVGRLNVGKFELVAGGATKSRSRIGAGRKVVIVRSDQVSVTKGVGERIGSLHAMSAPRESAIPRRRCVALEKHRHVITVAVPRVEPRGTTGEQPSPGGDGVTRLLAIHQVARQELQENLGLPIATHRARDGAKPTVGVRDRDRRQRVRWTTARSEFAGMTGLEGETDAAVVQKNPYPRDNDVGTESRRVRLQQ